MKKSKQMKKMKQIREIKKVGQILSVALFALCVDTSFAFGTYNHNITIRNQPMYDYADKAVQAFERDRERQYERNMLDQQLRTQQMMQHQNQMFQMQQQQQLLNQQEHLQRLNSDPEYALRDKLNKKDNALGRLIKESDEKLGELNKKWEMLNEEFGLLHNEAKPLNDKTTSIFARLDTLTQKEKALDTSKLLPQEKDEVKNFLSKAVELNTKRQAMIDKDKAYEKAAMFVDEYVKLEADFANLNQKYLTEAQKYQHKVGYDNKAYEAFLNIQEKRAEVLINWAREYEIFVSKTEKLLGEFDELSTEYTNFCKDIIKHKSFVRKYERFFKKVEKRLGV